MTINTERLGRLAGLLEQYTETPKGPRFDLCGWSHCDYRRGGFLWLQTVECGTTACAVGLACLSGEFIKDGLGFVRFAGVMLPTYAGEDNWPAIESFFGLNEDQSRALFSEDAYKVSRGPVAAAAVAHRIRRMIKRSQQARRSAQTKRTKSMVQQIKAAALDPALEPIT